MRALNRISMLVGCLIFCAGFACPAEPAAKPVDWTGWRGPNRDGISAESGWSTQWPGGKPKELWKVNVGAGYGVPAVVGKRVYLLGAGEQDNDVVYCLDADTGAEVWKTPIGPGAGGMSFCSMTVSGKRAVALSKMGVVNALDTETGKVLWSRDIQDAKGQRPGYGVGSSPAVVDGVVILNAGSAGIGLDLESGKTLWGDEKEKFGTYASPVLCDTGGKKAAIVFTGSAIAAVNPKTGEPVWKQDRDQNKVPSWQLRTGQPIYRDPILYQDYFLSEGILSKITDKGLVLAKSDVWSGGSFNTAICWKGAVFGSSGWTEGTFMKDAAAWCVDLATGAKKWEQKGIDGYISLVDGKVVMMSYDGQLVIYEATPEKYIELSRATIFEVDWKKSGRDGAVCTAPVLSGGRIFCRNRGALVCLDVRKP